MAPPTYTSQVATQDATVSVPPPYQDDELPQYEKLISKSGALMRKREMATPFNKSRSRRWSLTYLDICGTQLVMHSGSVIRRERRLSLQYAKVGLATDYDRRSPELRYFRIRAEGEQFLFETTSSAELFEWIFKLQTAIDLALPLELRDMPSLVKMTVRRSRAAIRAREAAQAEAQAQANRSGANTEAVHGHNRSESEDQNTKKGKNNTQKTPLEIDEIKARAVALARLKPLLLANMCPKHPAFKARSSMNITPEASNNSNCESEEAEECKPAGFLRPPLPRDFFKLSNDEPWTGCVYLRGRLSMIQGSKLIPCRAF